MKNVLGVILLVGCQRSTGTSSAPSVTATTSTPSAMVSASVSATASAPAPSTSATTQPTSGGQGFGNGHCPCGCDHSKDMVEELRSRDRATHLFLQTVAEIDESLRTIGEREDAGFITDRMVEHRLRLMSYGREIGRTGPGRFTTFPPMRSFGVSATNGVLRVHADLMAHGETTEIIRGKEKDLPAAFVLRLDVENQGATPVSLRVPALEGSVELPVSRWYLAGTDGEPWSGALGIGETAIAYVIGYMGEPVLPGTEIEATVSFEWMTIPVKTRARTRWNETP